MYARELGEAEHQRSMLAFYATSCEKLLQNGPTSILMVRPQRLGWQVTSHGLIRDRWNVFDLFTENIDSLRVRSAASWSWIYIAEISHRLDFEGIQWADPGLCP